MDWWDYRVCIERKKDGSFLKQTLGQPMEDFFPKEITATSREVLREKIERLSLEREVTMPLKHETYSSLTLNAGAFLIDSRPKIKNVIFNDPATIVFWEDGTKTVVKCENEEFDKEKGLAMACMKKMMGNKGRYFNEVKKWTR